MIFFLEKPIALIIPISFVFSLTRVFKVIQIKKPATIAISENTTNIIVFSKVKAEIEKEAKELLEIVGLAERMKHKPNQLSGGEKQRVAIARAMINKPKLILADEPTGNLDEDTGEMIFSLFRKINKERNQSIVVVTHARDLSQVTDRQIYLKRGVLE